MSYLHIGKNFTPPDIHGKVTGKARYAEDFRVEGMVYARLYTSPMPHARVISMDLTEALAIDGVIGVLTADDVPEVKAPGSPVLTNEPVYVGDPILAIAAIDEQTAENAIAKVRVTLEPLPFSVSPTHTLRPGGPAARLEGNVYSGEMRTLEWKQDDVDRFLSGREPTGPAASEWQFGDLEAGFDNASVVIEESFVTSGYAHTCMEPRSVMSYWQNGKCHVYGSTQSQSFVVPFLARMLGIEPQNLVYVSEYCGGGFGSKIAAYPVLALPGHLSKKIGRPVMLRITREEEYYIGSARVGFQGWIKAGFKPDGKLSAVDLYIVQDLGSRQAGGDASSAGGAVSILYQPEALRLRDVPVLTNTTPRGPQRGPGQNQIAAVFEPMLDKAARELGIDRLEIRRINAPDSSAKLNADQGPVTSAYMVEALDKGADLWNWAQKKGHSRRRNGSKVTGVGIGQAYHDAGVNGYDGLVRITPDGIIHLHSGVGNLGTYSYAATTRAAAEVLKADWAHCVVEHGTTEAHLPWSSYQAGSNTIFTHTRANHVAALDLLDKMKAIAAQVHGGSADDYDIADERVFNAKGNSMSYAEVAQKAIELGGVYSGEVVAENLNGITKLAIAGLKGSGLIGAAKDELPKRGTAPGLAVAFAEIEIDLETGKLEVLDYLAVAECGTVVHPQGLAGQLRGGAVWGFGMASLEHHVYDPQNGLPANVGFYQTKPPTYLDVPSNMDWAATDIADPDNPVGARGIGEPAMGCATAAVMCAISDALDGHLFNRTPVTPDMILNHVAGLPQSFSALGINEF
ncbi:MAG: xanthine dehydrogenase family protein molybdopterin-binding subunit [Proteobacteria bacterium]|nr:xanthine dehydrogenase family protein molybdopterin-binding subunit [Pseudomonadota bacterium]